MDEIRALPADGEWIERLREYTAHLTHQDMNEDEDAKSIRNTAIPGCPLHPGASYVTGRVYPHDDLHYPRWSYMLILHADEAVLKNDGREDLQLEPNTLVELELWREHSLEQPDDATLVWVPFDIERRAELDEALTGLQLQLTLPTKVELSRVVYWPRGRFVERPDYVAITDHEGRVVRELTEDALTGPGYAWKGEEVCSPVELSADQAGFPALWDQFLADARVMGCADSYYEMLIDCTPEWIREGVTQAGPTP